MDLLFDMSIVKSFSAKISTSTLKKHLKEDHKISKSKSVDESTKSIQRYFSSDRNISLTTKRDTKFILIRDLVLLCCRDLLPFNLVDGHGLKDFLEKYGVSAVDDLPHRTSISRALESVYDDCKVWLIAYLRTDCPNMVALTFDIWSDKYRRRSYITFTLHYVDSNFELKDLTLSTCYFPDRHTGENIFSSVENVIDCYGLTSKTIYMVTDAAYNMGRACRLGNYPQLLCLGHALHNLVTVDGFKETTNISRLLKKVRDIVKALRYRVSEFEKLSADQVALAKEISDINEQLRLYEDEYDDIEVEEFQMEDEEIGSCAVPTIRKSTKTLKLDVKTRWNSQLTMLKSIVAQDKNVINVMLHKTDHADLLLSNMDYVLLKELVDFLQNFEKITEMFSGDKYATLNYAIVFRSEIHSLIECEPHDSDDIKLLKQNMLANFGHRFPLNDMIVLASILDTRFQNLLDVKIYLRDINSTAVDFLLKMSSQIDSNICSGNESIPNPSVNQVLEKKSLEKRQSYLDELAEKHSTLSVVAEKSSSSGKSALERECYLLLSMASKISVSDALVFWKDHAKLMPKLSSIAAKVYSIPATSTPSERNFSIAGIVINSRRSQISPDNLDRVLFVHNNYNSIKGGLFPNIHLN